MAARVRDLADVAGAGDTPSPVASTLGAGFVHRPAPAGVVPVAYHSPVAPDIPAVVLAAYERAALAMGAVEPGCGLTWWMLAGIGKMESDHADGGLVDAAGNTREPIRGPWLDGGPGTAAIPARPASATGGAVWERAEGPMQFLPTTWTVYGGGGNPDNIDDAALGAARYLCAGNDDLSDPTQLATALFRYNRSEVYVAAVLGWARAYATGAVPVPGSAGTMPVAPRDSSAATATAAAAAVTYATVQLGLPYVWGGNGPERGDVGFDCSGLTHAAYVAAGIPIPRTAQSQYDAGPRLQPGLSPVVGDLVFYGSPGRVHHVGLYVGGGRMINAPTFGEPVQLAPYRWPGDDYLGATRPAARPGSMPPPPLHRSTSRGAAGTPRGSGVVAAVPPQARRMPKDPTPPLTPTLPTPTLPTPARPTPTLPSATEPSSPASPSKPSVTVSPSVTGAPSSRASVPVTPPPQPAASSSAPPGVAAGSVPAESPRTLIVTSAEAAALLATSGHGRSVTVLRRDVPADRIVLLISEVAVR